MAFNFEAAAGVRTRAKRLGISVPQQLAILGFDNQPISEALQLSTIDQGLKEIWREAFRSFYRQTSGELPPGDKKIISHRLIERATT
ncbi:substrate-binding domain-containing protein [Paenactinomyces guangxiensis]|uniref:Substrate-binding domain-containing protein n=1 Tax=Paenactinomyces guangxiensis TaxID=1490290 RepID=A0A7W1WN33_9BACL|nr:substrate-binding domain-containing protein [Paenactinomyces guangxiensis]MBA4492953.1 substrate-binding domain-containing protein [Paenactinomyces guangxiensis]MBH8590198.1 substrate-binding domain-containing protein [Paenactinomyces guangxiensis]